ncbi:MAG TPA: hypothetical protein VFV50_17680 [Bdellovibrionales bacterium]|nr:hypothetical protein [Bdellovibrionales bacterium]
MLNRFALIVLSLGMAAQAQAQLSSNYTTCQQAFSDAQSLALYSQFGERSIKDDVDRIREISEDLERSLNFLSDLDRATRRLNNLGATVQNKVGQAMTGNVQEAYNNNYNVQRILEGALDKYEQRLREAGLDDVVSHIVNAKNTAGQTERYIKQAEAGANQSANAVAREVTQELSGVSNTVSQQGQSLRRGNERIQRISERLVGRDYWSFNRIDPYSKIGTLERIMTYMERNACIK